MRLYYKLKLQYDLTKINEYKSIKWKREKCVKYVELTNWIWSLESFQPKEREKKTKKLFRKAFDN